VEKDAARGVEMYTRLAEAGDTNAMRSIGDRYLEGDGVEKDDAKGGELSARADVGDANIMRSLDDLIYEGAGVENDTTTGVDLYRRSVEGGTVDVMRRLVDSIWEGDFNFEGHGVETDAARGSESYKRRRRW
jgi:uncharacterized protein